ncbi:hypothetical protein [Salinisphaera sp. Q1T1-3]|uniref:hypothetical protein n=1 Tax=Salinisphaera sp. Q1T1-3 TaxID=2321229 RepID=UPI0011C42AAD|nr:hypothetical protein [Salinisphaera sp. Q1T1-3]
MNSDPQDRQRLQYRTGIGDWEAFRAAGYDLTAIYTAAEDWRQALAGITHPWLCWNVDNDWCLVQQQLVRSIGWTPVIGFDPRVGPPRDVTDDAVVIDFNARFGFPNLFFHFPLEFAFLFCRRLAFWHSDLLVRPPKMETLGTQFSSLQDGEIAVTGAWYRPRDLLKPHEARFWELIGCTTEQASRAQFEAGCGWWMNFYAHPNCPSEKERHKRRKHYWDHGTGIRYWAKRYRKPVQLISERFVEEGHCSQIKNANYQRVSPNNERRHLAQDIRQNFELDAVCARLGIDEARGD